MARNQRLVNKCGKSIPWASKRAMKRHHDTVECNIPLAIALSEIGHFSNAAKVFVYMISNSLGDRHPELYTATATCLNEIGRHAEALGMINGTIKRVPDDANAHAVKSYILSEINEHEKSFNIAQKALELNPQQSIPHRNKGVSLSARGQHEAAIESFEQALAISPHLDGRALTAMTASQIATMRYEDCVKRCEAGLKDEKKPWFIASILNNQGCAFHLMEDLSSAILAYSDALRIDPNFINAHLGLAKVFIDIDKLPAAEKYLDTAEQLSSPGDNKAFDEEILTLSDLLHSRMMGKFIAPPESGPAQP